MLLTKREEQLLKAFLKFGKLSMDNMSEMLGVSKRTVYRTLSDLTNSLATLGIAIIKESNKYYLSGDFENISELSAQATYTRNERLNLITYNLLISRENITNESLQDQFGVSNVTVIQDIADIEKRLKDFNLVLKRRKGYGLAVSHSQMKRCLLAIMLTKNIHIPQFWKKDCDIFDCIYAERLQQATQAFQKYQEELPEFDAKLNQFFIILLSLSTWDTFKVNPTPVSKVSLEFSQKVFAHLSHLSQEFYSLKEILYYASLMDELVIKRQNTPLFNENFDSEFFYNVSNLINKVGRYTKSNFAKDQLLFKFLFNHIRLNLAIPVILY